jgi:hypothetical protein
LDENLKTAANPEDSPEGQIHELQCRGQEVANRGSVSEAGSQYRVGAEAESPLTKAEEEAAVSELEGGGIGNDFATCYKNICQCGVRGWGRGQLIKLKEENEESWERDRKEDKR